jgi:hypothetical protein
MWRNTITGDQVEFDEDSCSLAAASPANERQPFIVVIRSIVVFLAERRSALNLPKETPRGSPQSQRFLYEIKRLGI